MNSKNPKESIVEATYMVLPDDTNPLGILRGGVLMEWMDITSEIAAQKHSQCIALTIGIDEVSFKRKIRAGDVVNIKSQVTRAFNTSMEIFVQVWSSTSPQMDMKKSNEAFFTFVAVDSDGIPCRIPQLSPSTKGEEFLFRSALARKEHKIKTSPKRYKTTRI